jgi:hypothetical protein
MEEFSLPAEDELWKFIKKITNNSWQLQNLELYWY